jgi:hypothetical protein
VQLLVAVKQGEAGIVGDEIYLDFLVSTYHYNVFITPEVGCPAIRVSSSYAGADE